jgi:hypothetical protein
MTIVFRPRPLTTAEANAGWGGVLVSDIPSMNPTYFANASDMPHFPESPMGKMLAKVMGATLVVEA